MLVRGNHPKLALVQAAYDMELAKHATHAALEMDNTRRLVERYILGNDVLTISDVEPLAGQVEGGGPPNYSAFPYPLESEGWPTNYPVPEPPTLDKVYLLPEKASPPLSETRRERLGAHFL
eukprot:s234_g12.t1